MVVIHILDIPSLDDMDEANRDVYRQLHLDLVKSLHSVWFVKAIIQETFLPPHSRQLLSPSLLSFD